MGVSSHDRDRATIRHHAANICQHQSGIACLSTDPKSVSDAAAAQEGKPEVNQRGSDGVGDLEEDGGLGDMENHVEA